MQESHVCEVGQHEPFGPWLLVAGLVIALLTLLLAGCVVNPSEDPSEIMDTGTDTGESDEIGDPSETDSGDDFPVLPPNAPDLGSEPHPETSLVDACCWCEGDQPHCAMLAVECAEGAIWYEDCILITGIEPDPEPYCWEHAC